MSAPSYREQEIRALLENLELKVVFSSPDGDYHFEYYTSSLLDRKTKEPRLSRTYKLIDIKRGGETAEPWDVFDLDKQTGLVTNLLSYSGYSITRKISGWEITCSSCGHVMRGKIWQLVPKSCRATQPAGCGRELDQRRVQEIEQDVGHR